jgi:hypothetical protein
MGRIEAQIICASRMMALPDFAKIPARQHDRKRIVDGYRLPA